MLRQYQELLARQQRAERDMLNAARAAIGHRTKADALHEWAQTPTGRRVMWKLHDHA